MYKRQVLLVAVLVHGEQLIAEGQVALGGHRARSQLGCARGCQVGQQLAVKPGMYAMVEVEAHAVGKEHHHGLAVRDVAEPAERVAERMHDAHHGVAERLSLIHI